MSLTFKVADQLSAQEQELGVVHCPPVYPESFTSRQYFEYVRSTYQEQQLLLTPSEVGCTLAHLGVYQQIVDANDSAFIFEADIKLTASVLDRAQQVVDVCGAVDFIHLGIHPNRSFFGTRPNSPVAVADPRFYLYGTFAYFVSPRAAQSLLDFHAQRMRRADAWKEFFAEHDLVPHYYPLVRHPSERGGIDLERRQSLTQKPLSLMLLASQLLTLARRKLLTLYRLLVLVPLTKERCALSDEDTSTGDGG